MQMLYTKTLMELISSTAGIYQFIHYVSRVKQELNHQHGCKEVKTIKKQAAPEQHPTDQQTICPTQYSESEKETTKK